MRVLFALCTSVGSTPAPATSCLSYVGTGCPGLASAVRSHFPSLQWVRHSLLSPPSPTPPFLSGGGLGRGRRELGAGVRVWYKESCLLAFSPGPFSTYPCSGFTSVTQALCVLLAREGGGARWEGGWEGEMVTAGLIPGP